MGYLRLSSLPGAVSSACVVNAAQCLQTTAAFKAQAALDLALVSSREPEH